MNRTRQLYRSRNALVGGVCAGIAERFDVDPLVVRILFLIVARKLRRRADSVVKGPQCPGRIFCGVKGVA